MDRAEKIMLILKAKFHDNEDIHNFIDSIQQLKRPLILLSHDEKVYYDEFVEDWYSKGWIIWTGKKSTDEEDVE